MNDTKRSIIIIHFRFFAFTIFNCNLIFFLCLNVCVVGQVYRARHIIINLMHFFALGGWQNVRKANKSVATQKNMQPFQLVNVENKFNERKKRTQIRNAFLLHFQLNPTNLLNARTQSPCLAINNVVFCYFYVSKKNAKNNIYYFTVCCRLLCCRVYMTIFIVILLPIFFLTFSAVYSKCSLVFCIVFPL